VYDLMRQVAVELDMIVNIDAVCYRWFNGRYFGYHPILDGRTEFCFNVKPKCSLAHGFISGSAKE